MIQYGGYYGYGHCDNCGLSVPVATLNAGTHECNPETRAAHQTTQARKQLETFETAVDEWTRTPHGMFAVWLAQHRL